MRNIKNIIELTKQINKKAAIMYIVQFEIRD